MFSVKVGEGVKASSFNPNTKFYVGDDDLLPLERFLPSKGPRGVGRGSIKTLIIINSLGGPRGGRGGFRGGDRGGGRGGFRGGDRGGGRGGFRGGDRGGSRGGPRGGRGGFRGGR